MHCPNKEKNMADCNCSYEGCSRTGICCECLRYHRSKKQLPACYFDSEAEKTYNRSIEYFSQTRKK
ncbi:MAG: hypothetical protein HQL27_06580 [Candidatus Omnitrophica bacterium]|nr:hypothetical protein [Candidatus Omnitrophota bacterium]